MNIKDLKTWAEVSLKKDNAQFIQDGARDTRITKIRGLLQMIVDRSNIVIRNTEKNNQFIADITKAVATISEYGVSVDGKKKEEETVGSSKK